MPAARAVPPPGGLHQVLRVLLGQVDREVHPPHLPVPGGHGGQAVRRVHLGLQLALPRSQLRGRQLLLTSELPNCVIIIIMLRVKM